VNKLTKVLIIDDAAFMRMTLKMMLEKNRFEIIGEADNGKVGIRKYKECNPDVVTMDITMPEMGGIEALKAIREFDPNAKIVMISAMGQERMVMESILSGAKSFIVKPFKEENVIETLTKVASV
jgi:two-component system, chemotaxis family, chemotaxis protein CheY